MRYAGSAIFTSDLTLLMCRVQQVRQDLNGHLTRLNGDRDWSFILSQVGMFSFTGLDKVWPLRCLAASLDSLLRPHIGGLGLFLRAAQQSSPHQAVIVSSLSGLKTECLSPRGSLATTSHAHSPARADALSVHTLDVSCSQ